MTSLLTLVAWLATAATVAPRPVGPCGVLVDADDKPLREPVTWVLRTNAGERRKLDDQCDAVGPIVLRAAPDPTPSRGTPDSVTVVGWNVHVGGGDIVSLVRRLESGALTGRPVSHYVLLLEEAHRAGGRMTDSPRGVRVPRRIAPKTGSRVREDILSVARTLNLALYYVPSMRNGTGRPFEDRGNAILSTFPLEALSAIELPFARQRRVAIGAVIRGVDRHDRRWALQLVTVHLDALAGASRLWIFASGWRGRQARTVIESLEQRVPSVLGGDLNTWFLGAWEPAYRRVARAYPDTRSTVTPPGASAHGRLDYVFYRLPPAWTSHTWRPDDACAPRQPRCGSDHRPIVGTVSWAAVP